MLKSIYFCPVVSHLIRVLAYIPCMYTCIHIKCMHMYMYTHVFYGYWGIKQYDIILFHLQERWMNSVLFVAAIEFICIWKHSGLKGSAIVKKGCIRRNILCGPFCEAELKNGLQSCIWRKPRTQQFSIFVTMK